MATHNVLFDMDGLLVDTEPVWAEAERRILARREKEYTRTDQAQLIGVSLRTTAEYLAARAGTGEDWAAIAGELTAEMKYMIRGHGRSVPGLGVKMLRGSRALLTGVMLAGLPHALVTSTDRQLVYAILGSTGMRFQHIVDAQTGVRPKPDPEPYLRAAWLLGTSASQCTVVEDSPAGVASGLAAGCRVIAVPGMAPVDPHQENLTVVRSLDDLAATPDGLMVRVPA